MPNPTRLARQRAEILAGLLKAAERRHDLLDELWQAETRSDALDRVQRTLDINEPQARAVLELHIGNLTAATIASLRTELSEIPEDK